MLRRAFYVRRPLGVFGQDAGDGRASGLKFDGVDPIGGRSARTATGGGITARIFRYSQHLRSMITRQTGRACTACRGRKRLT